MRKIHSRLVYILLIVMVSSCSMSEKGESVGGLSGKGGSLARFTIKGDYLYTVDQSSLHTFSLTDSEHPKQVSVIPLGIYTETIYPYQNSLLLGTETGMFVFNLNSPSNPQQTTYFQHIRSCDPVVAQNGFAYITLNSGNLRCNAGMNELQIVDISNLSAPKLIKTLNMVKPLGLDISNDTLFVCDNGLKVLNVANKQQPVELYYVSDVKAQDVICQGSRIIITGPDGLYQYDCKADGLKKISVIPIQL